MKSQHTATLKNEYPKLVRDKIPQIIADNDGKLAATRVLDDDNEFMFFLLKKVVEESNELSKTTTDPDLIEEIADIYEVIDALLEFKGITRQDIEIVQDAKRAKRGGFKDRLLMLDNS